jgi:hypothetical protein
MALTVITLSVARSQLVEQRIANNQHRHTRLLLLAEAGLAEAVQLLERAPQALRWNYDAERRREQSRLALDTGAPDVATQLFMERRAPSAAPVLLQATAGRGDGTGLQARVSQWVRPLSLLSPLGEAAPPLVLNGCADPPSAALEIRPRNWNLDEVGDAVWLNDALPCPPPVGIDTHGGAIAARTLGPDLWSTMLSVDRETFTAMAAAQDDLPVHERSYRVVEPRDLRAGRWTRSVGSATRPVALYFPASTGCPEFAPGVRIYGLVFVDGDCTTSLAPRGFELYGSLMINGNCNAAGTRTELNHIQVADATQTGLRFPVLRSVPVPGSWRDF